MELKLQATQKRYHLGEAIEIYVLLENGYNMPIWVNSRMGIKREADSKGELLFTVKTKEGDLSFNARINMGEATAEDFSLVAPETSIGKAIDLSLYFDLNNIDTYQIEVAYFNDQPFDDQHKTFLSKRLTADPIIIHIQ